MEEKRVYTKEDCKETGDEVNLDKKVVVIKEEALRGRAEYPLAFCIGGGRQSRSEGGTVKLVDLQSSTYFSMKRKDILGTLNPKFLPEHAKLQLSQIRRVSAGPPDERKEVYFGYCFLEDGRYSAGVWLNGALEAVEYAFMQKPYQHRVMLCDSDDFCVLEIVNGEVTFPQGETIRNGEVKAQYEDMHMT